MFSKRKKNKIERINKTKEKMQDLFKKVIKQYKDYNLVYAYNRDFNLEINDYVYTSIVIGYNVDNMKLVIIETNKEFDEVYSILKLTRDDFTKASYNINLDEYVIYFGSKKNDKVRFSLISENYIDVDILAYIEQMTEIEDFKDFFQEFKRRQHKRK